MKCIQYLTLSALVISSSLWANETELRTHLDAWKMEVAEWKAAYAAGDQAKKQELTYKVPDETLMTRSIWKLIGTKSVKEVWALPGIIWLIQHPNGIAKNFDAKQQTKLIELLLDSIEKTHIKDPALSDLCPTLCTSTNPQCQRILELIKTQNSSEQTKGVASLALALISKGSPGTTADNPNINAERLKHLRQAIISAFDCDFGGRKVGDIAADEVYEINNLSLRRKAPLFELKNTQGVLSKLPEEGKNTLLLFWDARQASDIDLMTKIDSIMKKFDTITVAPILIGVTEQTAPDVLSHFEIDGDTLLDPTGDGFKIYRIRQTPFVYLIDNQGVIQYRGIPDIVFQTKLTQFIDSQSKAIKQAQENVTSPTDKPSPTTQGVPTKPAAPPTPPPLRELPKL